MSFLTFDNLQNVLDIATSVIGTASVIAAITPTTKDDFVVNFLRKIMDLLAFNFWNAKNEQK